MPTWYSILVRNAITCFKQKQCDEETRQFAENFIPPYHLFEVVTGNEIAQINGLRFGKKGNEV